MLKSVKKSLLSLQLNCQIVTIAIKSLDMLTN